MPAWRAHRTSYKTTVEVLGKPVDLELDASSTGGIVLLAGHITVLEDVPLELLEALLNALPAAVAKARADLSLTPLPLPPEYVSTKHAAPAVGVQEVVEDDDEDDYLPERRQRPGGR